MRVAIIPARGGSRRIPRKNIRLFHGKPIIAYSIEAAKASGLFKAVYVSTEDSEVANVALDHGAIVVRRPWKLAKDEVGTQEVMRDVMNGMSYDLACCIYATAPLMAVEALQRGCDAIETGRFDFAYSVGGSMPTGPFFDAGQFYWGTAQAFRESRPLEGGKVCHVCIESERVCDINTEDEWHCAERMYEALQREVA